MFGTVKITLEEEGLEEWCFSDRVGDEAVEEAVEPDMMTGGKNKKEGEDISLWGLWYYVEAHNALAE